LRGDREVVVIDAGRQFVIRVVIVVERDADLLHVVRRCRPRREEPGAEERGQQHREQEHQERQKNQELKECQTAPGCASHGWSSSWKLWTATLGGHGCGTPRKDAPQVRGHFSLASGG